MKKDFNEREITSNNKTYIFVEIPDNTHSFWEKLSYEGGYWLAMFEPRIEPYLALQSVRILGKSDDRFKIISTTKDITDEIAENIGLCTDIKSHKLFGDGLFKKYYSETPYFYKTAKGFLQELAQRLELDINKNYLILQKL